MKPHPSPTPVARHTPFNGHDNHITCISGSHDNQWALTCSADKTAKLWRVNPCTQQPLMNISTVVHNYKEPSSTATSNHRVSDMTSIVLTVELAILYKHLYIVEPLYCGHHWDPHNCPYFRGVHFEGFHCSLNTNSRSKILLRNEPVNSRLLILYMYNQNILLVVS